MSHNMKWGVGESREGELTFMSERRQSAIDYMLVLKRMLYKVENFRIGNYGYSDHLPIIVTLTIQNPKEDQENRVGDILRKEVRSNLRAWRRRAIQREEYIVKRNKYKALSKEKKRNSNKIWLKELARPVDKRDEKGF